MALEFEACGFDKDYLGYIWKLTRDWMYMTNQLSSQETQVNDII